MERGSGDDLEADVNRFPTAADGGTDWEACYQRGETPWDKGAASPGLVEALGWLDVVGRVLVPGCGLGHDVRALGARAEAVGLDISPSAVERAAAMPGGGRYVCGDLFRLPFEWTGSFDWVWEHTCFCAIQPELRPAYVDAVATVLRPGGRFLGVFYLDPGHGPGESGPPFGVSPAELDWLFGSRFRLVEEWDPSRAYPGREGRERMRVLEKRVCL